MYSYPAFKVCTLTEEHLGLVIRHPLPVQVRLPTGRLMDVCQNCIHCLDCWQGRCASTPFWRTSRTYSFLIFRQSYHVRSVDKQFENDVEGGILVLGYTKMVTYGRYCPWPRMQTGCVWRKSVKTNWWSPDCGKRLLCTRHFILCQIFAPPLFPTLQNFSLWKLGHRTLHLVKM